MKKSIKYFSIILFCSLFMILMSSNDVSARYDASKNTAHIAVSKNEVKITVNYQRGANSPEKAKYVWCKKTNPTDVITDFDGCTNKITSEVFYKPSGTEFIAKGTPEYVDNNLTTQVFTVSSTADPLLSGTLESDAYYALVVVTDFCAIRSGNGAGEYNGCIFWDNRYTVLDVSINDLKNGKTVGGEGAATDEIEDQNVRSLMEQIADIVHGTVMPIIWVVLGLFFVVKGTLLGVQIVKSADEPQVRQEKVSSLKWLAIGVGIAYASSFVVDIVIGFFENAFK